MGASLNVRVSSESQPTLMHTNTSIKKSAGKVVRVTHGALIWPLVGSPPAGAAAAAAAAATAPDAAIDAAAVLDEEAVEANVDVVDADAAAAAAPELDSLLGVCIAEGISHEKPRDDVDSKQSDANKRNTAGHARTKAPWTQDAPCWGRAAGRA